MESNILPPSIDRLENLLNSHGIETTSWGIGHCKSVVELYEELHTGEARIIHTSRDLLRILAPVTTILWYQREDGMILLLNEAEQKFLDGSTRSRQFMDGSVSGKAEKGEGAVEAARREIREELGIEYIDPIIPVRTQTDTRFSESYPGLLTRYDLSVFMAELKDSQFNSSGYIETQGRVKSFFRWVEAPTLQCLEEAQPRYIRPAHR